jgi:chromosomal replication initiation ATPase DnaA
MKRKKEAEEMPIIRESILTNLLIDVADAFKVPLKLVQKGDQQQLTVLVRVIFYYVARSKTEYSLKSMALVAGRKDHSICIGHLQKVYSYFYDKDQEFLTLWNHYLSTSKLFTSKDFSDGTN